TSTGAFPGRTFTPTEVRACLPASPNTSTSKSENPFITRGCSPNPSTEATIPTTLTTRLIRSRLPSAARVFARSNNPAYRAACAPCSTVRSHDQCWDVTASVLLSGAQLHALRSELELDVLSAIVTTQWT